MNELIVDPTKLEFMPVGARASEAKVAELESAAFREAIRVRELTLMPVMRENLQSRPSSHWGINE
jgi:hypothetical protein